MAHAVCTPDSGWPLAELAGVRSLDSSFSDRALPVSHVSAGTHTLQRSAYASGVVLIPTDSDPTAIPAVLPVVISEETSAQVTLDPDDVMDFGVGVVIVFI